MRILTGIDLPFLPNCGSMIICNDIYSKMDDVHFVALEPKGNANAGWSDLKNVHLLDIDKKALPPLLYEEQLREAVLDLIYRINPDMIHIQHLSFGMAKVLSDCAIPLPKVSICHGTSILFAIDEKVPVQNIKNTCSSCERVIFPSLGIYRDLQRLDPQFDITHKKRIVHWGLEEEVYKKRNYTDAAEKWKLIYAGRLTKNKGVDSALWALTSLPDNFRLTIVGEGPEEKNLKLLIARLHLEERVDFLPFQDRKVLWQLFDQHHALMITSKKIEAFGIVALEAQARGLPVIHSSLPAFDEILQKGAVQFKAGCEADLADKIKEVFENKQTFIRKSINAYSNSKAFSLKKTIALIERISKESHQSFYQKKLVVKVA